MLCWVTMNGRDLTSGYYHALFCILPTASFCWESIDGVSLFYFASLPQLPLLWRATWCQLMHRVRWQNTVLSHQDKKHCIHTNDSGRCLTHWGWVTHICTRKLTIIGSDAGLSPGRRQVIIWTNAGILLIGPLGTKFNGISIKVHTFSLKKSIWKCCLENGNYFVSASMC